MSEIEDRHCISAIPRRPIKIVRGKGAIVWDSEGNEYVDCVGGFGVAIVGHCNETVVRAINEQTQRLITNPYIFYDDVRAKLYEKLARITPNELSRMFLCNSGTESVECALKIARRYTGRKEIIAMKRGFHGRSMGSLSATWNPRYRKNFEPLIPGFKHARFNDFEDVKEQMTDDTAAVIIEPVQGEGGVHPVMKEFMQDLRELCNENQTLLIFDEVQTGFGRTGKMFALEHYDVVPDILCLSKGMAGGVPMGATVAKPEIFESLDELEHMSTMGGNPLACAASVATIDFIVNNNLPENAGKLGSYFIEQLRNIQSKTIREVRGLGLMIGVELRFPIIKYISEAMRRGVLLYSAGITTLRMLPPLVITKQEIDRVVEVLSEAL